jgi:hypothetical protein
MNSNHDYYLCNTRITPFLPFQPHSKEKSSLPAPGPPAVISSCASRPPRVGRDASFTWGLREKHMIIYYNLDNYSILVLIVIDINRRMILCIYIYINIIYILYIYIILLK